MTGCVRTPGRPRALPAEKRRARILDAAADEFIEHGYRAARMDGIARRCRMSKKTLYQEFRSKEALYAALLLQSEFTPRGDDTGAPVLPPDETLRGALMRLASWILTPRQIGLTRLIISESQTTPSIAARFRFHALERARRVIQHHVAASAPADGGQVELASIVYGAVIAELQLRALVGEDVRTARERDQLAARVDRVIRMLNGTPERGERGFEVGARAAAAAPSSSFEGGAQA